MTDQVGTPGVLVLAGTPIGHARQASPALVDALTSADVIAAEDTRRLHTLLVRLGVRTQARVVSFFDANEADRTPGLLGDLLAGATVVVATDAGMPSVSDPGYRLVRAAIDAGVRVTAVPGPSAVTTALAVSGLASDRFCFEGFLPRRSGERLTRLGELASEPRTMVFFEAPHRLADMLGDTARIFGADRPAVVCRELSKPFEEIVRLPLGELATWAVDHARGEITVVIAGASPVGPRGSAALDEAVGLVDARIAQGAKLSVAVAEVAAATGVRRNELYRVAMSRRAKGRPAVGDQPGEPQS